MVIKKRRINHNAFQAEFWDKRSQYSTPEDIRDIPYPALLEMKEFFEFMDLKERSTILEIGCGKGRYTLPLLRRGHIIHATEISRESLKYLVKRASEEKFTKRLTTEETDFEDEKDYKKHLGKFDVALCVSTIHHFNSEKRDKIFFNIVRSVKPGGMVIALEPNPLNPLWYLLFLWRGIRNVQADSRWTADKGFLRSSQRNLKRSFRKAGLKEITVKRYAWLPSRFANNLKFVVWFNEFLLRLPFIKNTSAFIWIKGRKL